MGFFDIFTSKDVCPSCNQPFETAPISSGICKNCKKKYYICKDNETKKQILTNKEGREEILLKNRNLKHYIEWFNPFYQTTDTESSEKMIKGMIQIKNDWFAKHPNGTFNNFLWSTLNEEMFEAVKNKEYKQAAHYYKNMAVILNEEGKDNYKILCEAHKMHLLSLKEELKQSRKEGSDSDIIVTILSCGVDSLCENCQKVVGKEMLLEEAIKLKLLPVKDCSCKGYCNCEYIDYWKLNE
jgi:hypothetical protein